MANQNSTTNVEFEKYYSRLRRIIIPLPNFNLFHKPYGVKDRDSQHIKREHIHSKLKQWLSSKSGNLSGSYLVTGFRGMGKTSIVGNVVDEMIYGNNHSPIKTKIINLIFRASVLICAYVFASVFARIWGVKYSIAIIIILSLLAIIGFVAKYMGWKGYFAISKNSKRFFAILKVSKGCFVKFKILKKIIAASKDSKLKDNKNERRYIHLVNLNVGNEINSAHDILSLITHITRDKFRTYIERRSIFTSYIAVWELIKFTIILSMTIFFYEKGISILNAAYIKIVSNDGFISTFIVALNNILLALTENNMFKTLGGSVI